MAHIISYKLLYLV